MTLREVQTAKTCKFGPKNGRSDAQKNGASENDLPVQNQLFYVLCSHTANVYIPFTTALQPKVVILIKCTTENSYILQLKDYSWDS